MDWKVKLLQPTDIYLFESLIKVFNTAFEEKNTLPSRTYLTGLLEKPHFVCVAALHEEEVIGGITAWILPSCYSESAELFIYDVAVTQQFRRKGVGRSLFSFLKDYCRQNQLSGAFVAASEEDVHAVRFYEEMQLDPEQVRMFSFDLDGDQRAGKQ